MNAHNKGTEPVTRGQRGIYLQNVGAQNSLGSIGFLDVSHEKNHKDKKKIIK